MLAYIDGNNAAGAHLVSWDRSGNSNQCFDVQFVDAAQTQPQPQPPASAPRYGTVYMTDQLPGIRQNT